MTEENASAGPQTHRGYLDRDSAAAAAGTPMRFIASTPGVKRDGLDLRASGWRLDTFRTNPVFQWVHSRTSPPLGRVDASAADVLMADVVFDQEDQFARTIESKYRRGFLHAVSVSWDFVDRDGQRIDYWRMSADDLRDKAFYDMTELSGVPIPADPQALVQRQRSALSKLGRELVDLFDEQEHPDSPVTVEEIRTAVVSELTRLGIPTDPAPAASGIEQTAARALLDAFNLTEESHA
ncbi:hypothetical protein [Lysinibacillus fusiformis]|uniref:hypothetical protein n=1 Tax=Lysinibacillus fusiformis TaxID=28031 RepID=UPI003D07478E